MNAPLLVHLSHDLVRRGCATLRFNFRGLGESEGSFGLGVDEVQDALGAIDEVERRFPEAPVAIAGWSFGAAVAIRATAISDVVACAAIAPAVRSRPDVTAGLPPGTDLGLQQPLLVVCAENDDQVALADCSEWARSTPQTNVVTVPGANHFFWAKYEDLAELVGSFLEGHLET